MTYADIKYNRSEVRRKKREERIAKERRKAQRFYGTSMILVSVVSTILSNGDITAAVMFFPLGMYAIFTKEDIFKDER